MESWASAMGDGSSADIASNQLLIPTSGIHIGVSMIADIMDHAGLALDVLTRFISYTV